VGFFCELFHDFLEVSWDARPAPRGVAK
jgi:hypothetical protein